MPNVGSVVSDGESFIALKQRFHHVRPPEEDFARKSMSVGTTNISITTCAKY